MIIGFKSSTCSIALVLFVLGWFGCAAAAEKFGPLTQSAQGIRMSVNLAGKEANLSWRQTRQLSVNKMITSFNGNELTMGPMVRYPGKDGRTDILLLIDTSDPRRAPVVDQKMKIIERMLAGIRTHHRIAIAEFSKGLTVRTPFTNDRNALVSELYSIKAEGPITELYKSVLEAVDRLAKRGADRKVIFIFSDGAAEDEAFTNEQVVESALENNIIINGIGFPAKGNRAIAVQSLERLAKETEGFYQEANASLSRNSSQPTYTLPPSFYKSAFKLIDSGGRRAVTLDRSFRFPFEEQAPLLVSMAGEALDENRVPQPLNVTFRFEIERPLPKPEELISFGREKQNLPIVMGTGGVISALLLILIVVSIRRVIMRRRQELEATRPIAFVKVLDSEQKIYDMIGDSLTIGRGEENDVIFANDTVSRVHALIKRTPEDGAFSIHDLNSENGVLINEKVSTEETLFGEETIELGEVRFRFSINS